MVSSTDVDAMANNVALQHDGQQVVNGNAMTNSGKRILTQITFDVLNVRQPLLSFCTETSSRDNHLQLRLRSHHVSKRDSEFDMNGILPSKVLVIAGESATNDVNEEVYDNDGNERNEVREASAGDRQAIADADQAGQLGISGDAKTARSLRTPER